MPAELDLALSRELATVIREAKQRAQRIREASELWEWKAGSPRAVGKLAANPVSRGSIFRARVEKYAPEL